MMLSLLILLALANLGATGYGCYRLDREIRATRAAAEDAAKSAQRIGPPHGPAKW